MKDQGRSTRKRTGGRLKHASNKKRHQLGREPAETTVGETRVQYIDSRGNEKKVRALSTNVAQVADGDAVSEAEIENVVDNPSNVNYARRNIITKGAIIETSAGRARVSSSTRPDRTGQRGPHRLNGPVRHAADRFLNLFTRSRRGATRVPRRRRGRGPRTRTNGRRGGARRPVALPADVDDSKRIAPARASRSMPRSAQPTPSLSASRSSNPPRSTVQTPT